MQRQLTLDVLVTAEDRRAALRRDVERGLFGPGKNLPPVWFYDETGSRLFDEITRLPEYYPTRAERSILEARAAEIAEVSGADTLVEVGSGTSEKTRLLLDAMAAAGRLRRVVLLDISEEVLREAAHTLADAYGVDVHAIVGDFRSDIPRVPRKGRALWAFLGGTIGNLTPRERARLLFDFGVTMDWQDHLLLGTDLVKDTARLVAAYDDGAGVTAAFNLNVLDVLNTELNATFDPALFEHRAVWNADDHWIEMRLRARTAHEVYVAELGRSISFAAGEEVRTEISAKFTGEQVVDELAAANLVRPRVWQDTGGDFQLTLATPYC